LKGNKMTLKKNASRGSADKSAAPASADKSAAPASADKWADLDSGERTLTLQEQTELMKRRIDLMQDHELLQSYDQLKIGKPMIEAAIAARGIGGGEHKIEAAAGAFEGRFTVTCELLGDKMYSDGQERRGIIRDYQHLIRSGALVPADDETADYVRRYTGLVIGVREPDNA
jgi:hypothetical protein